MDVTIAEIVGIVFGIFLLLLSTVLLIGPDRLRGIFLLSTPDLRVYDPLTQKLVNPSKPLPIPNNTNNTNNTNNNNNTNNTNNNNTNNTNNTNNNEPRVIPGSNSQGYLQPNQYAPPATYPTFKTSPNQQNILITK
jgi:hypothetical protein